MSVSVELGKPDSFWETTYSGGGAVAAAAKMTKIAGIAGKAFGSERRTALSVPSAAYTSIIGMDFFSSVLAVVARASNRQNGLYSNRIPIDRPVGTMKLMDVKTAEAASKREPARDRLLAAADELFYAEGVHVVVVDRIVARAGVTKASLYNTFGSKHWLVRAYLENHFSRRQRRIAKILAEHTTPRAQLQAVFDEVEGMLAGSSFRGCRFISAAAESAPGEAGGGVGRQYRRRGLFPFYGLSGGRGARGAEPRRRPLV